MPPELAAEGKPDEQHRIPFTYRGEALEYVVSNRLLAGKERMLDLAGHRWTTLQAHKVAEKEQGMDLPLNKAEIAEADRVQQAFYDEFFRLNAKLKDIPGAQIQAYKEFVGPPPPERKLPHTLVGR